MSDDNARKKVLDTYRRMGEDERRNLAYDFMSERLKSDGVDDDVIINRAVKDFMDSGDFETTYEDISLACEKLFEKIRTEEQLSYKLGVHSLYENKSNNMEVIEDNE